MTWFLGGLVLMIFSIGLFSALVSGKLRSPIDEIVMAMIVASFIIGLMFFSFGVKKNVEGYPKTAEENLPPIGSTCEILYTKENNSKSEPCWITLIELPNRTPRLFHLDQKPVLGLVKIMPNYEIVPLSESIKD